MTKMGLLLVLALASVACSSGSSSELLGNGAPRENHPMGDGTSSDTSPTEGSAPDASTPTTAADAGVDADADAGDSSTPDSGNVTPPNAFTGAGAYTATLGASTIKGAHPNGGNPAKVDCLTSSCHGAGGGGPRFAAGGTVYTSAAATTAAAQVEVRLLDAKGVAVSTYTDVNGNFFVRAAAAANLTFPVKTGARNAAATRPMAATIAVGSCNGAACHGGALTGVIHVP